MKKVILILLVALIACQVNAANKPVPYLSKKFAETLMAIEKNHKIFKSDNIQNNLAAFYSGSKTSSSAFVNCEDDFVLGCQGLSAFCNMYASFVCADIMCL